MSRDELGTRSRRAALLTLAMVMAWSSVPRSALARADGGNVRSWRSFHEIPPGEAPAGGLRDVLLTPSVFDRAREDLGDLRLFDGAGKEVSYDLRVLRPDRRSATIEAQVFNKASAADGSAEAALDLGAGPVEHNEVEVDLPGANYRRHAQLDGGPDGQDWRTLAEKDLIDFVADGRRLRDRRFTYPPSRFRYLRVRVTPDPVADREPPEILGVEARRSVDLPGEVLILTAEVGPREPVPTPDGPGSAWIIDLGGDRVPCDRLSCEVDDPEFVRNITVEAGGPADSGLPFVTMASGVWRRRAGEERRPMTLAFPEARPARLRLVVVDAANPPLTIRSATFGAPARQLVFPSPAEGAEAGRLRLFTGNPEAEAPRYDFARNLPERLDPPPDRSALGPRQENPEYVPPPPPFTERWPWLIYGVLGLVVALLAGLVADLARRAIARHDEARPEVPAVPAS